VEHIPAVCPRCRGTNLKKVPGSKVIKRDISGKLPSGFAYRAVHHTRKRCACNQTVIVRTYFPEN
jgi:hypothetical protein